MIWCQFLLRYSGHVLLVDDDFRCGGTVASDRGSYKRVTTGEVAGRRIRADVVKAGQTKRLESEKDALVATAAPTHGTGTQKSVLLALLE